jgi:methionyl-tRNA formyltransferase
MKFKVNYIGDSVNFIDFLNKDRRYKLQKVFCEKKRISDDLSAVCGQNLISVKTKEYLESKILSDKYPCDFFLIYSSNLIISKKLIEKFDFYNFHPGSLRDNRGRNPIVWSIILGERQSALSLHKISVEIDAGIVISENKVPVKDTDTFTVLQHRLENRIPSALDELEFFLLGKMKGKAISAPGIYRPKIQEKDFTIDLSKDSIRIIKRKVNSQNVYSGALITHNNQTFYLTKVIKEIAGRPHKNGIIIHKGNILLIYKNRKILAVKFRVKED